MYTANIHIVAVARVNVAVSALLPADPEHSDRIRIRLGPVC